ncbi:MAG: HU family DNA-binding protein [Eubacterium sp.]|nr:HU family DNA-binding protein [Eubacterium sp.]
MNKTEFIAALAEKTGMKKTDAEKAVKGFTELVAETLKTGEKVSLVGFGTFEVLEREAREGRNPRTGKNMTIPASKAPKFKAGRGLKEAVNEK